MANIKKAALLLMNKKIEAILIRKGATVVHEWETSKRFNLDTIAGKLEVTIDKDYKTSVASLFCKFEDEKLAATFLANNERFNKHTGKFNFHYTDTDVLFFKFTKDLAFILEPNNTTPC